MLVDSIARISSNLLIQHVDWQGYEFNCKCLVFNMELGVLNILLLAGWQPYFNLYLKSGTVSQLDHLLVTLLYCDTHSVNVHESASVGKQWTGKAVDMTLP
jgi:hypothetical protein